MSYTDEILDYVGECLDGLLDVVDNDDRMQMLDSLDIEHTRDRLRQLSWKFDLAFLALQEKGARKEA